MTKLRLSALVALPVVPLMVWLLAGGGHSNAAGPSDAQADLVFGQDGSFTAGTCNLGGRDSGALCQPLGVAIDPSGNVYVSDFDNNRVLEFDNPLATDYLADRVFGQGGSFAVGGCNVGGRDAGSLCGPVGVAVDGSNLYVSDFNNNRVLQYNSPLTTDDVADRVFGQLGSFTTATCNAGGLNGATLCGPQHLALDKTGNLYVADYFNSRVLEYGSPLTTDTVADLVFGQDGSFTSGASNSGGLDAGSLSAPYGVDLDAAGNLYVGDSGNSRVLEYHSPLTSDRTADVVFGQDGLFTTGTCNAGGRDAGSLCAPLGVTLDSVGNLYVADWQNHRVLGYDRPLVLGTVADRVLGQDGSFTTGDANNGGRDGGSLHEPRDLAVDYRGNLYAADGLNSRVLEYDVPEDDADEVFGQGGSFGTNTCGVPTTAATLCSPQGSFIDAEGNLYVADGNRILVYFDPTSSDVVADPSSVRTVPSRQMHVTTRRQPKDSASWSTSRSTARATST